MTAEVSLRCPIAHQNIRFFFLFFFVSTNSTKILPLWKILKKYWRMKINLFLCIALFDRVEIPGRRINSERRKVFFFSSNVVLENNSLREEHIFLTLFTNSISNNTLPRSGYQIEVSNSQMWLAPLWNMLQTHGQCHRTLFPF